MERPFRAVTSTAPRTRQILAVLLLSRELARCTEIQSLLLKAEVDMLWNSQAYTAPLVPKYKACVLR